jgi:hypothetical protein
LAIEIGFKFVLNQLMIQGPRVRFDGLAISVPSEVEIAENAHTVFALEVELILAGRGFFLGEKIVEFGEGLLPIIEQRDPGTWGIIEGRVKVCDMVEMNEEAAEIVSWIEKEMSF